MQIVFSNVTDHMLWHDCPCTHWLSLSAFRYISGACGDPRFFGAGQPLPLYWVRNINLLLLSHQVVSNSFVTPWTVAHQAPLSRFPRLLEWVAISFSRGFSWPRDRTYISCIGRWILYIEATREAQHNIHINCDTFYANKMARKPWKQHFWAEVMWKLLA